METFVFADRLQADWLQATVTQRDEPMVPVLDELEWFPFLYPDGAVQWTASVTLQQTKEEEEEKEEDLSFLNDSCVTTSRHKRKRELVCTVCNKTFRFQSNLSRHVRVVHEKLRPHVCKVCNKAFAESHDLRKHVKIVHEGVKLFECKHCGRGFSDVGNLNKHVAAVHEKKKPHVCGICGRAFSHFTDRNRHERYVHYGEKREPKKRKV